MLQLQRPDLFQERAYINGDWVGQATTERIQVVNPATQEPIGSVPKLGAQETAQAIEAAQHAFNSWRHTTATERAALLRKWFELLLQHKDDLAAILTAEQGKTLAESAGEVQYGAAYFEWFSEEAKRIYGQTIPGPAHNKRIVVQREPIGVCVAITPWNFPSSMIARKVGAALAAGCTIVVKPASQTPFSALALAVLAEEAGIPKGVFSVVTGDASSIGGEMTSNEQVRKLSFTGSTAVGRKLMEQSAPQLKKLSMELGGNAPFIVFEDADLDAAVEGALASKFRNSGQTCVCANRIYVHDAVYDRFSQKLLDAVSKLKIGAGTDQDVDLGPLIDRAAVDKVDELIQDALAKGATLLAGGKQQQTGTLLYPPTVLGDMTADMRIAQEEIFGPVAPLFRFKTEDEVIQAANNTEFGLASYFYTQDLGRANRVAEALEYGMVGINSGMISNPSAPFGGVKQSGFGREGSSFGIEDYTVLKYSLTAF
ncbi:MAG TPA: NAD-dependent succinate-semialdehyde dehydrogenase [Candidatus Paenalcaligenes intestinipullorum]|uniref:NAD-dependent succinate-semialdehyde dehydrogenase n=1 Tax=Candidatus Paenalcaligenes intestinipullorum TaxID=2838718 RepID=A0A9D2RH27_9BURK|nr:NAD-dependent succinate-semialdehyde dehydrogenase [Candidatus Paenalcaligenes intestinipullorum]